MVLDKYVSIGDRPIVSGQDGKTGLWYCKELVTNTPKETKEVIGELNKIYNEYNKKEAEKRQKIEKKEKKKPEKKKDKPEEKLNL